MSIQQLTMKLQYANKRVKFAWAKYYESVNAQHHGDHEHYTTYNTVANNVAIPEHIKAEMMKMATDLKKKWECPICVDMIEDGDLEITNCGHFYCKPCLTAWKQTEKNRGEDKWKCAVCNRKHGYGSDSSE